MLLHTFRPTFLIIMHIHVYVNMWINQMQTEHTISYYQLFLSCKMTMQLRHFDSLNMVVTKIHWNYIFLYWFPLVK